MGHPFRNRAARLHRRRREEKGGGGEAYRAVFEKKPPNTRVAEAYARHLAYWGERAKAESVMTESGADVTPLGKQVMADLKAGKDAEAHGLVRRGGAC